MIHMICGKTGIGKSKQIIDMANDSIEKAKGTVVFVTMGNQYMYDLKRDIRHIDAAEYQIKGPKMFFGFLSGLAAQDFDLEYLYVDNFLKIIGHPMSELQGLFEDMEQFAQKSGIELTISASHADEIPTFIEKYLV